MAHTVPENFIPLTDAFKRAVEVLCTAPAPCIEATAPMPPEDNGGPRGATLELSTLPAKEGPTREANTFEKNDQAEREIEKLMRNAIADGDLDPFIRADNGQLERLVECESFRPMSFGVPGFENVPHHLTSPGPDTGGQYVLLKKNEFQKWLSQFGKEKRSGRKPKFDWDDAKAFAKQEWTNHGPFNNIDRHWKGNADLERLVAKYMSRYDDEGEPSTSVLKERVSAWVTEFEAEN